MPEVDNTKAILDAGSAIGRTVFHVPPEAVHSVVIPEGYKIAELPATPALPSSIRANPIFIDAASFIGYVNRFKTANTQIFASLKETKIRAVIDYHKPDQSADHGKHRANYTIEKSPEWLAWEGQNKEHMDQGEFAEFLEANASNIVRPDAATMLEIALTISASKSGTFKSAMRLANGERQFTYENNIAGSAGRTGQLTIPETFMVLLRPFIGTSPYSVECRLRYRIDDGHLDLWYDMIRAAEIQAQAFDAVVAKVVDEAKTPVYLGWPATND